MSTDQLPPLEGEGPPQAPPPKSGGRPPWLVPAIGGVVIVGLVVALLVVLLAGGGGDGDEAAAQPPSSGSPKIYVLAVSGPLERLGASARVTGRSLARAKRAGDLARVSRSADQQLAVVQEARSRIADTPANGAAREARGTLVRATQAHRAYLTTLTRISDLDAATARTQASKIQRQAATLLDQYRAFYRMAPEAPQGVTSAGLADLSGLNAAIAAKRKAEDEAAAANQGGSGGNSEGGGTSSSGGGAGTSSDYRLSIAGVGGSDLGSVIEVSANYCDRTPGSVNDFIYSFEIISGGTVIASDSYTASQTRACNTISMSFDDTFAGGGYQVRVQVDNITNNVSASDNGSLTIT